MQPSIQPHTRLAAATFALIAFLMVLYHVHWAGTPKPLAPAEAAKLREESQALQRAGKWDQALEPTLRLARNFPENSIYIGDLARIYHHLQKYREEAARWEQFLDRAPTPVEACPQIGQAYAKQGLSKQAQGAFERCLALDPGNPDSLFYLAHIYEQTGELAKAEQLYRKGGELRPRYTDFPIGLGRVLLRKGEPGAARELAAKVLDQSPDNGDALFVMGTACRRLGEIAAARRYFELGVQRQSGDPDLHLALAQVAEQDNDVATAALHYQRVVDLDGSNTEASAGLVRIRRVHP